MTPSPDDELLAIVRLKATCMSTWINTNDYKLLANLRNAAATFGEGSPHCESIRTTVEQHLRNMKARGAATNITETRSASSSNETTGPEEQPTVSFGNLAFRPRPVAKWGFLSKPWLPTESQSHHSPPIWSTANLPCHRRQHCREYRISGKVQS